MNYYKKSSFNGLHYALPSSSNTIKNWILVSYKHNRLQLIHYFQQIPFCIYLSFDLWSSPNHRSFLGVVAHWATLEGILKSATIGFCRFQGPHTGSNIAEVLWKILERFEITRKIGYITTDNATNNDTAISELATYFGRVGIEFNAQESRVRCFGHIINLIVKGFLWGEDWEAFEGEVTTECEVEEASRALKTWWKRGPLGKLHNISTWILRTLQRRDKFIHKVKQLRSSSGSIAGPLLPMVGNITRWSSDVDSIERAFVLKKAIDDFVSGAIREERQKRTGRRSTTTPNMQAIDEDILDAENPELISIDELTLDDWEDLKLILRILEPFRGWTLLLQGTGTERIQANCYIARVLPAIDELLSHLEDCKNQYSDSARYSTHLSSSINRAWAILDMYETIFLALEYTYLLHLNNNTIHRYYALADKLPAMYAAVALVPETKLQYFQIE